MSERWSEAAIAQALGELAEALAPDPVVLLGASALRFHRPVLARSTLDVDLAVAAEVFVSRVPTGWSRGDAPHRWVVADEQPVDIVPATEADLRRGHVDWPDGERMSLVGVDLAAR